MKTSTGLRYRVYVDSQLIWNPQLTVFLPKTFLHALEKLRDLASIDLRLPRAVADELIYQKSLLLQREADQLRRIKKQVSLVTTASFDQVPDNATMLQLLKKRFESFLAQHRINIVEPSVRAIDWARVISDSTWRQPPFATFSGDQVQWEKGFRDRLIVETILHDLSSSNEETVVVITASPALRQAIKLRLNAEQTVLFFENFRQLVDHSNLLDRDFDDAQIIEFQTIAAELFASGEGILNSEVKTDLQSQATPILNHISPSDFSTAKHEQQEITIGDHYPILTTLTSEALRLWALRDWTPVGPIHFIPLHASLEKIQADGKLTHLTWRTPVLLTQAFVEANRDPRLSAMLGDIAVKAVGFSIYWNVAVQSGQAQSHATDEVINDGIERVLLRPGNELLHQLAPSFAQDYLQESLATYETLTELSESAKKPSKK